LTRKMKNNKPEKIHLGETGAGLRKKQKGLTSPKNHVAVKDLENALLTLSSTTPLAQKKVGEKKVC